MLSMTISLPYVCKLPLYIYVCVSYVGETCVLETLCSLDVAYV
jgi:hypothetical protein